MATSSSTELLHTKINSALSPLKSHRMTPGCEAGSANPRLWLCGGSRAINFLDDVVCYSSAPAALKISHDLHRITESWAGLG